jgi:6-pyruvoyltetrahydropterin/6-carboxytetrahydropterin synthase
MRIELTQEVLIRSIHNLSHPHLTDEENKALYGPCFGTHGHHYKIRVVVSSPMDETSGLIFDRDRLKGILEEKIVRPYDGVDLNRIFENTACEALAVEFYRLLEPAFQPGTLIRIGIQETRKNYFEYPA